MKIKNMSKGEWGKIVAYFTLETSEGLIVSGFKLINHDGGMFVGFPSVKKGEEFKDTVMCKKDLKMEINKLAHDHYNGYTEEVVQNLEQEAISEQPSYADKDDIPF